MIMRLVVRHDINFAEALSARNLELKIESPSSVADTVSALEDSDILITNPHHWRDDYLDSMSRGDWVQTTSTGYAAFPLEQMSEKGILLSNALGNFSIPVAEHVFALALALIRQLPQFYADQQEATWNRMQGAELSELYDKQMTIVGLGDIGRAIAERALAFGMKVHATKRDPAVGHGPLESTQVYGTHELRSLLPQTDVLVLIVPLTDNTYHLIDEGALASLPRSAMLINVSRGPVVDQSALIQALSSGSLAYAGLDVFDPEPLPAKSKLWEMPNTLLTPHVAGRSDQFIPRFCDLFEENLQRIRSGSNLVNQIT